MKIANLYTYVLLLVFIAISSISNAQVFVDFETGGTGFTATFTRVPTGGSGTTTGGFVRTNPVGTTYQLEDDHTATGTNALITAQNNVNSNGVNDVDRGRATLLSPTYNITVASTVSVWYFFGEATTGDDPYTLGDDPNLNGDFNILWYSFDGGTNWTVWESNIDTQIFPRWTEATVNVPAGSQFRLRLQSQDGGNNGDIVEAGLDDFSITPDNVSVQDVVTDESVGTALFVFEYNGAPISGGFTVNYATADDTAIAGSDYTATSGTLTFSGTPGQQLTVSVPIIRDTTIENEEYFNMNITSISNSQVQVGSNGRGTIEQEQDMDGDGVSDSFDLDNDNDGIPDCFEDGAENTVISDVFTINGDASQTSPLEAQLTPDLNNQAGSITINDRVDFSESFSFSFEAYLGIRNNGGADGIAIFFHDDPAGANAVGDEGIGLGARGIQDGIVLELDTFYNDPRSFGDVGDIINDHGMIWDSDNQTDSGFLSTARDLGNIEDDTWHEVRIIWNADTQTIRYYFDGIIAGFYTGDLVTNYFGGNNLVYFGFSASTGGSRNAHRIRFNDLCDIPLFVDDDGDGIANYLDLDSDNDGILDVVEGGDNAFDTNSDGRIDSNDTGYSDTNNDGQSDNSVDAVENPDTDSDGLGDFRDTDSDNDTCFDALEGGGNFSGSTIQPNGQLNSGVNADGIPVIAAPSGQSTSSAVTTAASTSFDSQPTDQTITNGGNAAFSVSASGNGNFTYSWQQSTDNGSNWTDLSNGGSNPAISGVSTNTLQLTNVPVSYNGYQYRVVVVNDNSECVENNSNAATLSVRAFTVITNRSITYRVTPLPPRGPRGTPTNDITTDYFSDDASAFDIQLRNNSASSIAKYEIYIENVPYSSLTITTANGHTLETYDNGDGTFSHLFTSSVPLDAANPGNTDSSEILGNAPSPPGTNPGTPCNCISYYRL